MASSTKNIFDKSAEFIIGSMNQIDRPERVVLGFVLVFIIVFSERFSDAVINDISIVLRSPFGMVLGFVGVVVLGEYAGWIYGLLGVIAFILMAKGHRLSHESDVTVEQFSDLVKKHRQGGRWFVEKVLNEDPEIIETDRVETVAIQG